MDVGDELGKLGDGGQTAVTPSGVFDIDLSEVPLRCNIAGCLNREKFLRKSDLQ